MAADAKVRRPILLLLAVLAGIAGAAALSQGAHAAPRCSVRIDNPAVRNDEIVSVFRFHCTSSVRHASAYVVLERRSHRKWRKLASVKKRLDVRAGKRYTLRTKAIPCIAHPHHNTVRTRAALVVSRTEAIGNVNPPERVPCI